MLVFQDDNHNTNKFSFTKKLPEHYKMHLLSKYKMYACMHTYMLKKNTYEKPKLLCIFSVDYCTQEVNSIKIGQGDIY